VLSYLVTSLHPEVKVSSDGQENQTDVAVGKETDSQCNENDIVSQIGVTHVHDRLEH
jgi:hypothetical protein